MSKYYLCTWDEKKTKIWFLYFRMSEFKAGDRRKRLLNK